MLGTRDTMMKRQTHYPTHQSFTGMRPIDRQIPKVGPALPIWALSPSIQDHMVREEAKSLTPKQCAVVELALDTIKVRGPTPVPSQAEGVAGVDMDLGSNPPYFIQFINTP